MTKLNLTRILKEAEHIIDNGISEQEAKMLVDKMGIDLSSEDFSHKDFMDGINHETEHAKTVDNSPSTIVKIALDHLREDPLYYQKLSKIEK